MSTEEARLLGMSAERECALRAKVDQLERVILRCAHLEENLASTVRGLEFENEKLERENAALREKMKVSWDEISVLVNQNSALLEALKTIAKYDQNSPHGDGICPYGCDCPSIANTALIKARKEAQP